MPTDYETLVKVFISLYGMQPKQAEAMAAQMLAKNNAAPENTPETTLTKPEPNPFADAAAAAHKDAQLSQLQQYSQMLEAQAPRKPTGPKISDASMGIASGKRR